MRLYSASQAGMGDPDVALNSEQYDIYCERQKQYFATKESLIRYFESGGGDKKFPALDFLVKYMKEKGYSRVLSFGAGPCVLEHFLKEKLPDAAITATDFSSFYVENAKRIFPELEVQTYDFFKDNPSKIKSQAKFDIAVFFASSYVMDDELFIRQFKEISCKTKEIIDFQAGFLPLRNIPRTLVARAFKAATQYLTPSDKRDKFHGYCRTKDELRRLYRQAGLTVEQEVKSGSYEYVAILQSPL